MESIILFLSENWISLVLGVLAILLLINACQVGTKRHVLNTPKPYLIVVLTATIITAVLSVYLDMSQGSLSSRLISEFFLYVFFYFYCFIYTRYMSIELNRFGKFYDLLYYLFVAAILIQSVLVADEEVLDYSTYPGTPGPLYWTGFIYPIILSVIMSLLVFTKTGMRPGQKVTQLLYVYFPTIGLVIITFSNGNFILHLCGLTFIMLVYLIIYIDSAQKLIQREKELDESRIALMVSQIQPHFIYNTLNSIAGLCELDPGKARELTLKFSDYLRNNIHALENKAPIPFSKEFAHICNYLEIEQQRFRRLNVKYDIKAEGFLVPVLSLQPLVENAVKHGISMKRGGGTVKISTHETEKWYNVVISDDGVGFDPEKPLEDSHLGIANARMRIEDMGGELRIHSKEGEGTEVTVLIPKESGKRNEKAI